MGGRVPRFAQGWLATFSVAPGTTRQVTAPAVETNAVTSDVPFVVAEAANSTDQSRVDADVSCYDEDHSGEDGSPLESVGCRGYVLREAGRGPPAVGPWCARDRVPPAIRTAEARQCAR